MAKPSTTTVVEAEVLPPGNDLTTAPAEGLHNHFHRCAQIAAAQAVSYATLCGLELQQVRAKLAKPGKRSDLRHAGGGGWEAWVEANCSFGLSTAKKYIALAEGIKGKRKLGDQLDGLIDIAPSALDDDQRDRLLKTVGKSTEGQTLQQLYLEFGIVKANPHQNLKPGGATHTKGRPPSGKGVDEQLAKELAADLSHRLATFLQDGQHQVLDTNDLRDFDDALVAARETIKPYLKK